jgi:succinate dehydrogenase / fumarate reductase, membrane anchor subunit
LNLSTPLSRVLGLGSAKGGVEHWWAQRLSAVALVPLGLWLAVAFATATDFSYAAVVAWVRQPITSILLILTALTVSYHSYLGVQVVVEDYVHGKGPKLAMLTLSTFMHVALGIAGLFSILKVAFGSAS